MARLVPEKPVFSTHEVIDKAIEKVVRQDAAAPFPNTLKSVLAQGFRLLKPNLSKGALSGGRARMMRGVQSAYPNTTVNLLSSRPMMQLHAAVGDGIFLHILLHTATLILLPNTCYLQITGPLMGNLLQPRCAQSGAASVHVAGGSARSPVPHAFCTGVSQRQAATHDKQDGVGRAAGEGRPRRAVPGEAAGGGGETAPQSPTCLSKGRARASLRRRALRVHSVGGKSIVDGRAGGGNDAGACSASGEGSRKHDTQGQQAAPTRKSRRKSVLGLQIPRWKVLYSVTFPSRAGFPGGHFLNQLGSGRRCAAWLTREMLARRPTLTCPIAPRKASRPFRTDAPKDLGPESLPKKRSMRILKRDQALCALVQRLLRRQQRIPYGLLLERHCPPKVQADSPVFTCSQSCPSSWDTEASGDALSDADATKLGNTAGDEPTAAGRGPGAGPPAVAAAAHPSACKKRPKNHDARGQVKEGRGQGRHGRGAAAAAKTAFAGRGGAFFRSGTSAMDKRLLALERARERAVVRERRRQKQRESDTTQLPVSARGVGNFVWAVLRRLVPFDLWGSRTNLRAFKRSLRHFLGLRKYERFLVRHALHGFKVSHCRWLTAHKIQHSDGVTAGEGQSAVEASELDIGEPLSDELAGDVDMINPPDKGMASSSRVDQAAHARAEAGEATEKRHARRGWNPTSSARGKNARAGSERGKAAPVIEQDGELACGQKKQGIGSDREKRGRRAGGRLEARPDRQEAGRPVLKQSEGGCSPAGGRRGVRLWREEAVAASERVGRVVGFVWTGLVLPLIRTHFYVVMFSFFLSSFFRPRAHSHPLLRGDVFSVIFRQRRGFASALSRSWSKG